MNNNIYEFQNIERSNYTVLFDNISVHNYSQKKVRSENKERFLLLDDLLDRV